MKAVFKIEVDVYFLQLLYDIQKNISDRILNLFEGHP